MSTRSVVRSKSLVPSGVRVTRLSYVCTAVSAQPEVRGGKAFFGGSDGRLLLPAQDRRRPGALADRAGQGEKGFA